MNPIRLITLILAIITMFRRDRYGAKDQSSAGEKDGRVITPYISRNTLA